MANNKLSPACFIVWMLTGIHGNNVTLLPDTINVWENSDVTLTCRFQANELIVIWYKITNGGGNESRAMLNTNLTGCIPSGFLINSQHNYSFTCDTNGVFNVTILRVSRDRDGEIWKCSSLLEQPSPGARIVVKVAVNMVNITPYNNRLTLLETSIRTFQCSTSPCIPEPTIEWFTKPQANGNAIMLNNTLSSDRASLATGIKAYQSNFTLFANRSMNGWKLYCNASNRHDAPPVKSEEIILDIQYPPDIPATINGMGNGSQYNAIRGQQVNLSCSATGGNPRPRLIWNGEHTDFRENGDIWNGEHTDFRENGDTVTNHLSWVATGSGSVQLGCLSFHIMSNYTAYVIVNILCTFILLVPLSYLLSQYIL